MEAVGTSVPADVMRAGRSARDEARVALEGEGFSEIEEDVPLLAGVGVDLAARGAAGRLWHVGVAGGFTANRPGLKRMDALWKALGKAAVLTQTQPGAPLLVLTTAVPAEGSAGDSALRALIGDGRPIHDVIVLGQSVGIGRLRDLAGDR